MFGVLGCFGGVLGFRGVLGVCVFCVFGGVGVFWDFRVFGGFECSEVLWCLGVTVKRLRV